MISVLLVDNQPSFIDETKKHLESQGNIQVTTAESGKKALDIVQKLTFDVIISDQQLPQVDGVGIL